MNNQTSNEEIDKILIGLLKQLQPGNKFYPSRASDMMELDQAHQVIATLLVKARIEAYGHGLYTGAMPESIGKPIAKDYIAELEAQLTPKEKSGE